MLHACRSSSASCAIQPVTIMQPYASRTTPSCRLTLASSYSRSLASKRCPRRVLHPTIARWPGGCRVVVFEASKWPWRSSIATWLTSRPNFQMLRQVPTVSEAAWVRRCEVYCQSFALPTVRDHIRGIGAKACWPAILGVAAAAAVAVPQANPKRPASLPPQLVTELVVSSCPNSKLWQLTFSAWFSQQRRRCFLYRSDCRRRRPLSQLQWRSRCRLSRAAGDVLVRRSRCHRWVSLGWPLRGSAMVQTRVRSTA
mmetsp:Transcript_17137/g.40120  ORF Transcript_17137/g.40120 Transcript_17137/m.40120 type:complete len:255 (+) Transcript_17137:162-926(+)